MDAFNTDLGFDDLVRAWKGTRGDLTRAHVLYDTLVNGAEAAACHADLLQQVAGASASPAFRKWTLAFFLEKRCGAKLPAVATAKGPVSTTKPDSTTTSSTDFDRIWVRWPKVSTRMPEEPSVAKYAWDRAVAKHGLDVARDACAMYVERAAGLARPLNMSTFLEGDLAFYWAEAKKKPAAADEQDFQRAYGKYREVLGRGAQLDEDGDRDVYLRLLPTPAERFDAYCAILLYVARKRREPASKWGKKTKSWSSLLGSWQQVEGWQRKRDEALGWAWGQLHAIRNAPSGRLYYSPRPHPKWGSTVEAVALAGARGAELLDVAVKFAVAFASDEPVRDVEMVHSWPYPTPQRYFMGRPVNDYDKLLDECEEEIRTRVDVYDPSKQEDDIDRVLRAG